MAGRSIIEVDGGITPETAAQVTSAGANVLVAGSAIFKGGASAYRGNIAAIRNAGGARARRSGVIAPAHALTLLAEKLEPGERVVLCRPARYSRDAAQQARFCGGSACPGALAIFGLYFAGRASLAIAVPFAMVGIGPGDGADHLAIDTQYTLYAITDRRAADRRMNGFAPKR